VVLTGAASGMGEQMARQLATEGAAVLVLIDRDTERLAAVAADLGTGSTVVETHVVDLADRAATLALAEAVRGAHPAIDLLVNNAGVALLGRFDEMAIEDFEWVLDINLRAPVLLTHSLLPALKAAPASHVINMSSLFGLIAPAGQSAYCASKFGLRGFSESFAVEVEGLGIGVTTVHPGGIATRIATDARTAAGMDPGDAEQGQRVARALLTMDPAKAAHTILQAARRRDPRVLVGTDAKLLELIPRVAPGWMRAAMGYAASRTS
jgi:short-subunit dehydrogenase